MKQTGFKPASAGWVVGACLGALLTACGSTSTTSGTTVKTDALTFDNASVPAAYVNEDFTANLRVSGGVGPYGYRLASGSLPPGLRFADGTLSGKPTAQGAYTFTVEASDANLSNKVATYTLNVSELPPLAVELTLPSSDVRGETRIPVVLKYTRAVRAARWSWDVGPDVKVTRVQAVQDGNPVFWRQDGNVVTVDMGFRAVPRSGNRVALISVKPSKVVKLNATNLWYESRDGKGQVISEKKAPAPAPTQVTPAPTDPVQATPASTQTTPAPSNSPATNPADVPGAPNPSQSNPDSNNTSTPAPTTPGKP